MDRADCPANVDDKNVLMRLEMRGDRPQHLRIVGDVDIAIHRHDVLQIRVPAEQREHDLAGFAIACLIQRDVAVKVRARVWIMQRSDRRKARLQLLAHFRFARQTGQRQMLGVRAAYHIDEPGIVAPHHRGDAQHVVGRAVR